MGKILLRCVFGLSLILLPLAMFGQSGSDMGQSGSSMNSGQDMSATGCLQKGQEHGGYYLTDENGKTWELMGSGLSAHVGHKVTVTGHEMQGSKSHESKVESAEKAEYGGNQHADLKVTNLKMVSESCQ
ncbi:MAG: DUF5818 domain-containing protein [Candidatus Korobacteraceae bacterium]